MMTLNQIMTAIREQMFVELPDGRTGIIAKTEDYDWRNSIVTVTLENGDRVAALQNGEIKPALEGAFANPFAQQLGMWKDRIAAKLPPTGTDWEP